MGPMGSRADRIRLAAIAIAGVRTAVGAIAILAPGRARAFLNEPAPAGDATPLLGYFGVREILLGVSVIGEARSGYPSSGLLRLNAVLDAGDMLLLLRFVARRRSLRVLAANLPVLAAGTSVSALWWWMADRLEEA